MLGQMALMKKGQVSIELMVIIAVILAVFIPLLLHIYFKTNEANEQLYQVQAELLTTRLSSLISSVGNLGDGSSLVAEIFVPPNVKRIEIKNLGRGSEVTVQLTTQNGDTEITDASRFPVAPQPWLMNKPAQGLKRFNVSYDGQVVNVKQV